MSKDYKKLAIEAFKLNLKIKENILELNRMKRELLAKMTDSGEKRILLDEGKISLSKWKSNFSSVIRKEFNKLDNKNKQELYKTGLLKIQYRLDTKKFQELKDKKEKTKLDEYVIERKNMVFMSFKFNEKTRNMLKEKEEEKRESENKLAEDEDGNDDFLNEIEDADREFWIEMIHEMRPDSVNFTDDEPADISETESAYIGIEQNEDEDEDESESDDDLETQDVKEEVLTSVAEEQKSADESKAELEEELGDGDDMLIKETLEEEKKEEK